MSAGSKLPIVLAAVSEVATPVLFGVAIIILVFLPLMYSLPGPWALFNAFAVHNPVAPQPASQLDAFCAISQSFLERKVATPHDMGQR